MISFSSSALRRRLVLLCCSLAFLAFAGLSRADDTPSFSDPAVTAFAKDYSTFVDQYTAILKDYMAAAKANDTAKMQAGAAKMQEFQTKVTDLQTKGAALAGKVKPEEAQKFSDYMQACVKRMTDAMQ